MTLINVHIISNSSVVRGSHGVPNTNLFDFMSVLVDFGNCLFLSANDVQLDSNASSGKKRQVSRILTACFVIGSSRLHLTFVCFCRLSVVRKS